MIDKFEYISFDIFDTLIKRNVEKPSDIFELISLEYSKIYKKNIKNFKEKRILAEKLARKEASLDGEPNIDDIYKKIDIEKDIDKEILKNIEKKIEIDVCQQNKDFYDIYKYALEKNKKIIITSDMYLKKDTISKILQKAQIDKYEKLFLSNEIKLNKHDGKIYSYIIKRLNIKQNQILHIGDSKRGDFIQSRLKHINSILIPKHIKKISYYNNCDLEEHELLQYDMLQSFINNNLDVKNDIYYNIGYEVLGPLLYGYTKWLLSELESNNLKSIFFLAREGYLLKKAFDIVNTSSNITSEYIYVSRRSVRPALLQNIENLKDLYKIIKIKDSTSVKKFLKDIGLNENDSDIFKKYNYNLDTLIKDISEMNEIFDELKNKIKFNANKEKENIIGYLRQKKIFGNIAISDVGWAGSMQKSLCTILNDCSIIGYYMATTDDYKDIKKSSFLRSYEDIRPFVHLFENLFLAQHGTTLKYKVNNNIYEPVLDECEYSKEEAKIFINIQNGALNFIYDINNNDINNYLDINHKIVSRNIFKLGLNPNKKDVVLFEKTPYMETVKMNLIECKNILYYILHFKTFKIDFLNSGWKIGFLKKIFCINISYFKVYKKLYKFKR